MSLALRLNSRTKKKEKERLLGIDAVFVVVISVRSDLSFSFRLASYHPLIPLNLWQLGGNGN